MHSPKRKKKDELFLIMNTDYYNHMYGLGVAVETATTGNASPSYTHGLPFFNSYYRGATIGETP